MPAKDQDTERAKLAQQGCEDARRRESRKTEDGKDQVDEAAEESFPASDPPASNPGRT